MSRTLARHMSIWSDLAAKLKNYGTPAVRNTSKPVLNAPVSQATPVRDLIARWRNVNPKKVEQSNAIVQTDKTKYLDVTSARKWLDNTKTGVQSALNAKKDALSTTLSSSKRSVENTAQKLSQSVKKSLPESPAASIRRTTASYIRTFVIFAFLGVFVYAVGTAIPGAIAKYLAERHRTDRS